MANAESAVAKPYHHGDLRRALIEAALALLEEEQDWDFSLREVARRAGVSHNAPYNHFPEKRDLLAAVAAAGFETLRERLLAAMTGVEIENVALVVGALAYVRLGVENPALYRLMFGSALGGGGDRPEETLAAATRAKAVLQEIVLRGAQSGFLAVSPENAGALGMASLTLWSAVHGLTMLIIEKRTGPELTVDQMTERMMRTLLEGLAAR